MAVMQIYPEMDIEKEKHEIIPAGELFKTPEQHLTYDIPLTSINVALQMRPGEDFGKVDELAASIKEMGVEQPIRVARWALPTARAYVELNNQAYPERTPVDPASLVTLPDGTCLIAIYGHRRLVGSHMAGMDTIPARISEGLSFREAIQLQTAENLHHRPSPVNFARGLNQVYKLGQAMEMYPTKADFARHSGLSVEQTRDALRFCELPANIQELVVQGDLTYATAVQLSRLIPAVQRFEMNQTYQRLDTALTAQVEAGTITDEERQKRLQVLLVDPELLDQAVKAQIKTSLLEIKSQKMSVKRATKYISGEVERLRGEQQFAMFDEEASKQERIKAFRRRDQINTRTALDSLKAVTVATQLHIDDHEGLEEVINEEPIKRVLGKVATTTEKLAEVAHSPKTREKAFSATAAIAAVVEIDEIEVPQESAAAMF